MRYDEFSKGSFLVSRRGRKPQRIGLENLRRGMEIYCALDRITANIDRAQKLVRPEYERRLRDLDRAIRVVGHLSRSVSGVLGFIHENRLGRAFNREYRRQLASYHSKRKIPKKWFALSHPYQDAKYWEIGPDPSKGRYAPHFPYNFDNLMLFSKVSTELTRGYGQYQRFSRDIKEVRKLGNSITVEKRVNGVRNTLISLASAKSTIEGKSRRFRGGGSGRSTRRSRPVDRVSIRYYDRMLRIKDRLRRTLGVKRNTIIARITNIQVTDVSRGRKIPPRGKYHMPKLSYVPLRVRRRSGIADTVIDSVPIRKRTTRRPRRAPLLKTITRPAKSEAPATPASQLTATTEELPHFSHPSGVQIEEPSMLVQGETYEVTQPVDETIFVHKVCLSQLLKTGEATPFCEICDRSVEPDEIEEVDNSPSPFSG